MSKIIRLLSVALLAMPLVAVAHSELEKPLYVAADGVDEGRCHNEASPCRSIGYALGLVGKGGKVFVAAGSYEISNVEDLFHLVSGVVDIRGDSAALIGVPAEYRSVLGERGFHVVADRKGLDHDTVARTDKLLALHSSLKSSMKATPCSSGSVNGLPCSNVDLLSHVAFTDVSARPGSAADVWGFVDLNTNREYAIVGYNTGTAVFDVSDAENPREIGFIDGQRATWRDIKVHQFFDDTSARWKAYAYVTTDGAGDGMFVIDMSGLPHSINRVSYSSDFSAAHNVYAAHTDFATGLSLTGATPTLIIAGSSLGGGRFRTYSLDNPSQPSFLVMPNVSAGDYMHDAASMIITDARKDTQCVNAVAFCVVLFDFNETTVDLWDITVPSSPVRLSRTPYANTGYVHSGWVSEDTQTLFVQDELDEQRFGLGTTLRAFSISDMTAPQSTGNWEGPTTAIDHNGFVRGNRYYMSNYSRGLTILDISDPQNPAPVGRLDTYPFSDSANFVGAWGAYPFFPSGHIAVSDIDSGFYMAKDNTLAVAEGSFAFSHAAFGNVEAQQLELTVQRVGGNVGATSVRWEAIPATADAGDVDAPGGTLDWAAGDSTDKTISLPLTNDGVAEGMQSFFIKLYAPQGGATLSSPSMARVYVSDPGDATEVQFSNDAIAVGERGFGTAVVTFWRSGSAVGPASVDYAISNSDATHGVDFDGATSGTISWGDGDADPKWIEFSIVDDGTAEGDEFFDLTLGNASGATIGGNGVMRVTIRDGSGLNQAPNAIAGGSQTVNIGATVTLNGNQSNDPDGDSLTYEWSQALGPAVMLSNADTESASFTAPTVGSDTLLRFELRVSDTFGLEDVSTASVTVRNPANSGGGSGGGSALWVLLLLAGWVLFERMMLDYRLLAIRARRDDVDRHIR